MKDQRLILFILAAVAFYFIVMQKQEKGDTIEHYESNIDTDIDTSSLDEGEMEGIEDIPATSDDSPESGNCPGFVSSDLLPKEDKTYDFAEFSPANVDSNFLDSARFLSMQTSLIRNPNLQIRPEPEVPRKEVCPWNQSTIYRENTEPAKNYDTLDF